MADDVISADTKVARLVVAYNLCADACESQHILSSRMIRALLYAAITLYFSVAEREVLEEVLVEKGTSTDEILTAFDRLRKIRNKSVAHVDEKSDVYVLSGQADYYRAPPVVNRIAETEIGIPGAKLSIAYQLPDITAEDRDALHRLTAATADIYFQMQKTGRLLGSGGAGPRRHNLKGSIYNPDDTPAVGERAVITLMPKVLGPPKYRLRFRSKLTGETWERDFDMPPSESNVVTLLREQGGLLRPAEQPSTGLRA